MFTAHLHTSGKGLALRVGLRDPYLDVARARRD